MERLTEGGHVFTSDQIFKDISRWGIAQCLNKLSAYEDTGLTPEQVRELAERYTAMEINEIHIDEYYCPACGAENSCDQGIVGDRFCPNCGQMLK